MGPTVPEPLHGFTARDLETLKKVILSYRARPVNTPQRPTVTVDSPYIDLSTSSAIYIVRTPTEGIPASALVGSTEDPPIEVNGIEAQVYRINEDDGLVEEVHDLTPRVYNLSTKKVPGEKWAVVEQDRFGYWIVTKVIDEGIGDLAGAGVCQLLHLNSDDCVVVHTYTPELGTIDYYLPYDSADGHWRSSDLFTYPGGSGFFDFYYEAGRIHLKLAELELLDCGDGCFSGSWITGHGTDETGTGTPESESCNATVFTVCVECSCCPVDGWEGEGWYCVTDASNTALGTGTGTGTGTGEGECEPLFVEDEFKCDPDLVICSGPYATRALAEAACPGEATVASDCCPDDPIPETLCITFSNSTGSLAIDGFYLLEYNAGQNAWCADLSGGSFTVQARLACNSDGMGGFVWALVVGAPLGGAGSFCGSAYAGVPYSTAGPGASITAVCNPLHIFGTVSRGFAPVGSADFDIVPVPGSDCD